MKPIEVNWKINLPDQLQIDQMWDQLEYKIIDQKFEFINLLKEHLGGELFFKGFQFKENDVFDWFCSRGRLEEIDFNTKFLLSDNVLKSFVAENESRPNRIEKKPQFDWKSEFVIDGELASLLYHGGAYGSTLKKSPKEIKSLAQKFCTELFNEKYSHEFVRFYTSNLAWNSWFVDFIIDYTYVIICMESRTIWILAYTDTD